MSLLGVAGADGPEDAGLGRDASNFVSSAEEIAPGVYDARVGEPGDAADWYKVTLPTGEAAKLKLILDGRAAPCVTVYDDQFNVVAQNTYECAHPSPYTYDIVAQSSVLYFKFSAQAELTYTFFLGTFVPPQFALTMTQTTEQLPTDFKIVATATNVGPVPGPVRVEIFSWPSFHWCDATANLAPGESVQVTAHVRVVGYIRYDGYASSRGEEEIDTSDNYGEETVGVGPSPINTEVSFSCG
jgi:hypothetical protein